MKYAFLTLLVPKQLEHEVAGCSKRNMQDAANALQWHIYDGLCANFEEKIKLFNVLPIGSFPQYYTKPFVKESTFTDRVTEHINIGFCNVKLIRKYHQSKKVFKQLKKWCCEDDTPKTIFVYTLSARFTYGLRKIKKLFPTTKICAIVADLPDMTSLSSKRGVLEKLADKATASRSYSDIDCIDAFVLLTKQMADYMKITKPYTVMEGIATIHNNLPPEKDCGELKNILYTGTLHKKFGVLNLVEAFRKIDAPNYRLTLCGIGDSEAEIINNSREDNRIIYKGQLSRDEILKLQQKATVLVNPRQNNEEFTKYSFPSKNLEYLSSGTPLVAYKLDGIPEEYSNYINYVEDNSAESLKNKLIEICEDVDGSAHERALRAFEFVRNEKNSQKQTEKIKKMLDSL